MSKFSIGLIAGVISSGALLVATAGWLNHSKTPVPVASGVFICRDTNHLFVGPKQAVQQIHPETGRASLWPAVYCARCENWKPAPPMERLAGHAELLNCPTCQTRRSFDGVIPDTARPLR